MANLIITVIAIALVAIASLMGIYYGGAAYMNNQGLADAATILNAATQIAAAWNAYCGDNLNQPPTGMASLVNGDSFQSGSYLALEPVVPKAAGGIPSFPFFLASASATINGATGLHYFVYADMGAPSSSGAGINDFNAGACKRIQQSSIGQTPTEIDTGAQGQIFLLGNGTFGCGILSGTISNGLGGATVPTGDLNEGDYVFEYRLQ